jgi:hypothetical protein
MAAAYPVTFDMAPPGRMQRPHVAIRILVIIVLGFILSVASFLGIFYLGIPVVAAILVSQKGPERFLQENSPTFVKWGRYLIAAFAYMLFMTDRLPNEDPEQTIDVQVTPGGTPTVGSALLRIIYVIPHGIVLGIIGIAYVVVVPVAAISILIDETVPSWVSNFTRGYLRWETRVLAYYASLTDEYPPFSFD